MAAWGKGGAMTIWNVVMVLSKQFSLNDHGKGDKD